MTAPIKLRLHAPPRRVQVRADGLAEVSRAVLERRLCEAHENGVAAGEARSHEGAAAALDVAAQGLEDFVAQARTEIGAFAIELALDIAGLLLRRELDAGAYDLERIVRDTLAASQVGRGECVVHLAPADHARLEGIPFRAGTTLMADPDLEPGDVQIETPRGLLVRDRAAALASIHEQLLASLP